MTTYIGFKNNGIEVGLDTDHDGTKDVYFGFYYDKKGKFAGLLGAALPIAWFVGRFLGWW